MMDIIPLSRPLALFEHYSPSEIRRKDIPHLRDARILGWDAVPLPLKLANRQEQQCEVHTINELEQRSNEGYFAADTAAMRIQGNYYLLAKNILIAAQLASKAEMSFIDHPFVSVGSLDLLPARLLHVLDELRDGDFKTVDDNRTVGQLLAAGECVVTEHHKTRLVVEKNLRVFSMEVLRADLNGDGINDILVHQAFQVLGGTMSWTGSSILTRFSNDGLFERVPILLG